MEPRATPGCLKTNLGSLSAEPCAGTRLGVQEPAGMVHLHFLFSGMSRWETCSVPPCLHHGALHSLNSHRFPLLLLRNLPHSMPPSIATALGQVLPLWFDCKAIESLRLGRISQITKSNSNPPCPLTTSFTVLESIQGQPLHLPLCSSATESLQRKPR